MFRPRILAGCISFALSSVTLAADGVKKPAPGKLGHVDKSKIFEKFDTDGDGYASKDEFKKLRETIAEKMKDKIPAKANAGILNKLFDGLFDKLDADKDGKISKDEFEKFQPDTDKLKQLKGKIGEQKAK